MVNYSNSLECHLTKVVWDVLTQAMNNSFRKAAALNMASVVVVVIFNSFNTCSLVLEEQSELDCVLPLGD